MSRLVAAVAAFCAAAVIVVWLGVAAFAVQPAPGTVGDARHHPAGQPAGDRNRGWECDGNRGVGRGNPAHPACSSSTTAGMTTGTTLGTVVRVPKPGPSVAITASSVVAGPAPHGALPSAPVAAPPSAAPAAPGRLAFTGTPVLWPTLALAGLLFVFGAILRWGAR